MATRLFFPYFARPSNLHHTRLEQSLILLVTYHFRIRVDRVEGPSQPRPGDTVYLADEVWPYCDGSVSMPFLDGRFALNVAEETNWFIKEQLPTFALYAMREITPDTLRLFGEDPLSGVFGLRPFTRDERTRMLAEDPTLVVPREETLSRTFRPHTRVRRPFEESHLVKLSVSFRG